MNNLPIERINEVMDFDSQFPVAPTINDAHIIAQAYDTTTTTDTIIEAPTHTDKAINAASIYTLADPNITYYYNDILSDGDMSSALVLDSGNKISEASAIFDVSESSIGRWRRRQKTPVV